MSNHSNSVLGNAAFGGILLSIFGIHWQDLLQTIVLAIIGTIVSFFISALLRRIFSKAKKV